MTDNVEPKPKFKIGQYVYLIDEEHKVKKCKVFSIHIHITKNIPNPPFVKEFDKGYICYHLINERGYDVKPYEIHELNLYGEEYHARMAARRFLNDSILFLNDRRKKVMQIAQTNNSRIGKLEKAQRSEVHK